MTQTNWVTLSSAEAEEADRSLPYPHLGADGVTPENRAALLEAYWSKSNEIGAKHRLYLEQNYTSDISSSVILDRLYQQAWDQGHSGGYHEVENCYDNYTTFLKFVITTLEKDA